MHRSDLEPGMKAVRGGAKLGTQLMLEYAESFVARHGAWPGGSNYASSEELEEEMRDPAWPRALLPYVAMMREEDEFADNPKLVPAKTLLLALRRKLDTVGFYLWTGALPQLYLTTNAKFAWKRRDVAELLDLARRTTNVQHFELISDVDRPVRRLTFPRPENVKNEEKQRRALAANLRNLSNWQLSKMFDILSAGPDAEFTEPPKAAPRLWRDRTPAEKKMGAGYIGPAAFIEIVYAKWIKSGVLSEDHIQDLDPDLFKAYWRWRADHGVMRGLIGSSQIKRRLYAIDRATPWDEVVKIAQSIARTATREASASRDGRVLKRGRKPATHKPKLET